MILPDSIQAAVRKTGYGELAVINEEGQIHVILKVPRAAGQLLHTSPGVRQLLFLAPTPAAPVVGWFFEIRDPEDPLCLVAYFDVRDPVHNEILAQLPHQEGVLFHCIDGEPLKSFASARINAPFNAARIYAQAVCHANEVAVGGYDFDTARTCFQAEYTPDKIAARLPPGFL